jgi:serine/threonine-protein kinase
MPIILTVVRGPHTGKVFTIDRHDTFVVGRAEDAHLSLPADPYFSRHHLLIEANPPLCRVTDLHSRNGITVNGARVAAAELASGDEVGGGITALRVLVTPPAGAATLVLPPAAPSTPSATPEGGGTLPEQRALHIPGYAGLAELGRGAMGVVYRAVREADGTPVAVKTIRPPVAPGADEVERFLREARVLAALSHPRIVRAFESGESGGVLYFVMELVTGTDADRFVRANGPLPVPTAADLVGQLCEALAHAHAAGYVHRDVKPGNLLLAPDGDRVNVKLADFGLAKAYQGTPMSGLTLSGTTAGTPAFMPPEQVTDFKSARPATDQYAAGATAYFLLTGAYPFGAGTTREVLKRVLAGDADRVEGHRPDLPRPLAEVVHRAMAVRADHRFPDAAAFAAAFRRAADAARRD